MSDMNGYKYEAMANKVIQGAGRRPDQDESLPSSVAGHLSLSDMGSRVEKSETISKQPKTAVKTAPKPAVMQPAAYSGLSTLEELAYRPTNAENADTYASLLTLIHTFLPDASHDTIVSAADVVLELLKNDDLDVAHKQTQIDSLLDYKTTDVELDEMIRLANEISDYAQTAAADGETALVLDEDDEEAAEPEEEPEPEPAADENAANEGLNSDEVVQKAAATALALSDIDALYVQRQLGSIARADLAAAVTAKMSDPGVSSEDLRSQLVELVGNASVVGPLVANRWRIVFKTQLTASNLEELRPKMAQLHLHQLISELEAFNSSKRRRSSEDVDADKRPRTEPRKPKRVDLGALMFDEGAHLMGSTKVKLPKGSFQQTKKSYDIISVPAPDPPKLDNEVLVPISDLPEWAQVVFPSSETQNLNRIQSQIYPSAFKSDENLVICAPTGAGKTNVAMLTVLRTIANHRDADGNLDTNFKIVYIAPLKALVQEQMREFQRRLTSNFGLVVNQLSGDSNLTKQQIEETQVIVTTPEKWDVITRKTSDISYTNLVRLIIIDEIHLLHDERGPVLENLVSRTLRRVEESNVPVRLVGLSATLPNYEDVATFLRVDFDKGLFYFDASYRPCPLEQKYIGIKEKKAIKKLNAMNEACYEQMNECLANGHQMIIFVHSRKDTFKTANWLKEKLIADDKSNLLTGNSAGVIGILKSEAEQMANRNLKEIVPSGFGIHHAGLNKDERSTVEDLFAQGHIKVLVSTATLAWGVNLPAHTVVIKGTETYSPEKGTWVQLSPQDILQMLGRAGRPRYDKSGEGIIITSQDEVQYYLAILNQQLPIESQLMSRLADSINAEVVLETIGSLEEAAQWLSYTYLYIRMLKSPALYHVGADYADDEALYWKRIDLAHSALMILQENKLVNYDQQSGSVKPTELGKISSHFYITHQTMSEYNKQLRPWCTEIDILKIFASSGEFKYILLRQEEKLEVTKLMEKCPIPVKGEMSDPLTKVNILLQAYISRLTLDGFALMADMIYITQSAGRLLRALHEISLKKNWSSLAKITLNLCKMVEKRMWLTNSPFRQFGSLASKEIIRATESSHLPFVTYFNLSAEELAEAINLKGNSRRTYELLQQFPRLSLSYFAHPLNHELLRIQVEIIPEWDWNSAVHGNREQFLVMVEDCDGDKTLYCDQLTIFKNNDKKERLLDFCVPITDPVQPNYFVTFVNDRWLHSEFRIPIMISDLTIPKKSPSFTKLEDLQIATSELKVPEFVDCFDFKFFNKFESQVFHAIYNSNDNVFVGMSKGSGKTTCAELAVLSHWKQNKGRVLYINPSESWNKQLCAAWTSKYASITEEGKSVDCLTGDLQRDLAILSANHLVLATPDQFDFVSRRWRQRKVVQKIELVIFDDVHFVGSGPAGASYENVITRLKVISAQLEEAIRMVGLSCSLDNGRDFGEYLGCNKKNVYNFDPSERFYDIKEVRIQPIAVNDNNSLLVNQLKPCYKFVKENTGQGRSIIFVPDQKRCIELAAACVGHIVKDGVSFVRVDSETIQQYLKKIQDKNLKHVLASGVGYMHPSMSETDKRIVERLFENDVLTLLFVAKDSASSCPTANNVAILGTQEWDGREHRYVDYSINTVLEMVGCCKDEMSSSKVLMLTKASRIKYYSNFLNQGFPLESYYHGSIHDVFINEIATRTFKNKQDCVDWLTFTYFYRRIQLNPSLYGVKDTSHMGVSDYLSELIEDTVKELVDANLIEVEEDEDDEDAEEALSPINGAMIASHHNVSYGTMVEFNRLDSSSRLRSILEIVSSASEFESMPIRFNEEIILGKIYDQVPVKLANADFESPHFKVFVLLQAHFSRVPLSGDLAGDLESVLAKVLRIIAACVDALSSEGYLNAVQAIDLSQMVVQGLWNRDSPLKQLPHFDEAMAQRCKKYQVETVYDIMSLEDEERDDVLQLDDDKLQDVAEFVNKYPNVDLSYEMGSQRIVANEPVEITVSLERDEEMDELTAYGRVSYKKEEWWVVIGDAATKQLYAIKKTTIAKEAQTLKMEFTVPTPGETTLTIWCMCDSYLDADKETSLDISVDA